MTCTAVGSIAAALRLHAEITFVIAASAFATVVALVAGQMARFHVAIIADVAALCGQHFAANRVAAVALVSARARPTELLVDVNFPPYWIGCGIFSY